MTPASQAVQAKAIEIGKLAVRATTSAGSGHPTTAGSAILAVEENYFSDIVTTAAGLAR